MNGHSAALSGLRAIAIAAVIAYHWDASWAPGGFLGVDVFFVISGFLITSVMLVEWTRSGGISLSKFWIHRGRRVLPLLVVVVAAVAIWASLAVPSDRLGAVRKDSLWTLAGGANWHSIISGQSYFDLFSEPSPLRHTWFSSVIEQYYLLWPLLAVAALRLARGRMARFAMFCAAGALASAVLLGVLYAPADPSRAYYGTDTRASQFLVGGVLAVLLVKWSPRTRATRAGVQLVGALAAAAVVVAFVVADDHDAWLYYGGFLGVALLSAAVVAALMQPAGTPIHRVLSLKPVVWIGEISFGLYLWHWPVGIAISDARTDLRGTSLTLVRLAVTFGLSAASYYAVERPLRRWTFRTRRARIAAPVAVALVAVIAIVATAGATPPSDVFANPGKVVTVGPEGSPDSTSTTTVPANGSTPADPAMPTRLLLVGDSIAHSLSEALVAEAAARDLLLIGATRSGCSMTTAVPSDSDGLSVPWAERCSRETAGYQTEEVDQYQPEVVIWLSSWEAGDHVVNGEVIPFGTRAGDAVLLDDFDESRRRLTAHGATLVMLTMAPSAPSSLGPVDPDKTANFVHLNRLLRRFASEHPDTVRVVDLARIVCPTGAPCTESVEGIRLRPRDGAHFEQDGPAWVAPRLLDAIYRELGRPAS